MDNKTYEYMNERVMKFKRINNNITVLDTRLQFYKNPSSNKSYGQSGYRIERDSLGERLNDKLTEMTINVLTEEINLLLEELDKI